MKRFILGIVIGIILLILFVYFGGADYLKTAGKAVEKAGSELEQYEKKIKELTPTIEKGIKEVKERVKEKTRD